MTSEQNMMPIVNVAPLYDDQPEAWAAVDQAIGEACRSKGWSSGREVLTLLHRMKHPKNSLMTWWYWLVLKRTG